METTMGYCDRCHGVVKDGVCENLNTSLHTEGHDNKVEAWRLDRFTHAVATSGDYPEVLAALIQPAAEGDIDGQIRTDAR